MSETAAWLDLGTWIRIARSNRATTLVVIGLVFGVMSLFGPWFAIDVFRSGAHDPIIDFTTTSMVTHDPEGYFAVVPYDSVACRCASVAGAFNLALAMVGAALLLGAFTAVMIARGVVKRDTRVALAALSGVLLIVAPVALAVTLPGALAADDIGFLPFSGDDNWERSFLGQNTSFSSITVGWGPSWGWVISLIAGAFILVGVSMARRPPRPAPAPATAPPAVAPPPVAAPAQDTPAPPTTPSAGTGADPTAGGAIPAPSVGGRQQTSGES